MATHSSILVRKTSWTEEPGRLQSTKSQTRLNDFHSLAVSLAEIEQVTINQLSCLRHCAAG